MRNFIQVFRPDKSLPSREAAPLIKTTETAGEKRLRELAGTAPITLAENDLFNSPDIDFDERLKIRTKFVDISLDDEQNKRCCCSII